MAVLKVLDNLDRVIVQICFGAQNDDKSIIEGSIRFLKQELFKRYPDESFNPPPAAIEAAGYVKKERVEQLEAENERLAAQLSENIVGTMALRHAFNRMKMQLLESICGAERKMHDLVALQLSQEPKTQETKPDGQ